MELFSTRPFVKGALASFIGATTLLSFTPAHAEHGMDNIRVSGFVSGVYRSTDQDDARYLGNEEEAGINSDGSTKGTRFGLNINAEITDDLTIASQLFSSREEGDYVMVLDWAFVAVKLAEPATLKAGKIKFPVGIVNEYVDVGYAFPWITAPGSVYSEDIEGPNATREAFTGLSVLWEQAMGDVAVSANLFAGDSTGEWLRESALSGVTLAANWDDVVIVQLSTYRGDTTPTDEFLNSAPLFAAELDNGRHEGTVIGIKADWNNVLFIAETSSAIFSNDAGVDLDETESDASYATLGYQYGKFLPHVTVENFEKGEGSAEHSKQSATTIGLRYNLMKNTALKIELTDISVDAGEGLFEGTLSDDSIRMYGIAIDTIF